MTIDDNELQERLNKLMRKDVKIITSYDIRSLFTRNMLSTVW